jgi:hypothetical protein
MSELDISSEFARFDRMVPLIDFTDDCWLWTGRTSPKGYGTYGKRLAYHLLFELLVEPVPAGLQLDHLCRVPACVNPDHLEIVTPRENTRRGLQAKLTEDDIRAIRASSASTLELAAQYGVYRTHISKVRSRAIWADVA